MIAEGAVQASEGGNKKPIALPSYDSYEPHQRPA